MAPNKKTKKTPRRRPRATNQNKATASNKTNVRVTVNEAPVRRRGAANKGQSAAQPRGPQFVLLPAAQPAAQPQVIQQMPTKDLFEMMREIRNPPPPSAAEISDEPRRQISLRPEDVFYLLGRRDAQATNNKNPPPVKGGGPSIDTSITSPIGPNINNSFTGSEYTGVQQFDWDWFQKKSEQFSEFSMNRPNQQLSPGNITPTSAFYTSNSDIIKKAATVNEADLSAKLEAEQSGRKDTVRPFTPVVEGVAVPIKVEAIDVHKGRQPAKLKDDTQIPAKLKDDTQTPAKLKDDTQITKARTDYVSRLRTGSIKNPTGSRLREYGIITKMANIIEEDGTRIKTLIYYDTIKNQPIGKVIN